MLIPAILHGSLDFTALTLSKVVCLAVSNTVAVIALFIFFATFFEKLLKEPV